MLAKVIEQDWKVSDVVLVCLVSIVSPHLSYKPHLKQEQEQTSDIKMFWKLARCSWMAENTSFRLLEITHPQATIG